MRRRNLGSVTAQPLLVGAVTLLITVVAVFLAYNANDGLPFVPVTQLDFESPSGAKLVEGNEVREGGARIGFVDRLTPVRKPDGRVVANITIKLDAASGAVPRDSRVAIRPRSLTGLMYVELTRGRSDRAFADGETIPVDQSRVPVQLDDLQNMYDAPTRQGVRDIYTGAGEAFAFRGRSLNEALEDLPPLLRELEPVMRTLSDPQTGLRRFVRSLERTVRTVAPVAEQYGRGFSAGADALEAWSRDAERLEAGAREAPRTLEVGIRSLRVQRPFLENTRRLSVALRDAAEVMPETLPPITAALARGVPVQRESPELYEELEPTLASLEGLMTDDRTTAGLRAITDTVGTLRPITRFVGPYVTVCNLFNYALTYASDAGTEEALGTAQRTLANFIPPGTDGPIEPSLGVLNQAEPTDNLHLDFLAAAVDEQGDADCEAGQRGYLEEQQAFAPGGKNIVVDPATPGNQGTTYTGRDRVPEGQTFSRRPELGPTLPQELRP